MFCTVLQTLIATIRFQGHENTESDYKREGLKFLNTFMEWSQGNEVRESAQQVKFM